MLYDKEYRDIKSLILFIKTFGKSNVCILQLASHVDPIVTLLFGMSPRPSLISTEQGALHLEQLRQPQPLLISGTPSSLRHYNKAHSLLLVLREREGTLNVWWSVNLEIRWGNSCILTCLFCKVTHSYPVRNKAAKDITSFLRIQTPFILKSHIWLLKF